MVARQMQDLRLSGREFQRVGATMQQKKNQPLSICDLIRGTVTKRRCCDENLTNLTLEYRVIGSFK